MTARVERSAMSRTLMASLDELIAQNKISMSLAVKTWNQFEATLAKFNVTVNEMHRLSGLGKEHLRVLTDLKARRLIKANAWTVPAPWEKFDDAMRARIAFRIAYRKTHFNQRMTVEPEAEDTWTLHLEELPELPGLPRQGLQAVITD